MSSSPLIASNGLNINSSSGGNGSAATAHTSTLSSPKLSSQLLSATAITAPQLQGPPSAFITAAPGVHFLSVPSLLSLLPTSNITTLPALSNASQSDGAGGLTTTQPLAEDDTFLRTLAPRTLLLLSPERPPIRLERWAANTGVTLIHFGLGPCPSTSVTSPTAASHARRRSDPSSSSTSTSSATSEASQEERDECVGFAREGAGHEDRLGSHGAEAGLGGDQARMCNEALEIVLHAERAPIIILDFSGANEGALLVGCLRRLQRRNLASIVSEYRTVTGPRARAAHERFIEMFDTSAVAIPEASLLPDWFAQQLEDDEAEAQELAALQAQTAPSSPVSTADRGALDVTV